MRNLIAFPVLFLAVILQVSIVSRVQLLSGIADLPFLIIAAWTLQDRVNTPWHWALIACALNIYISALPWPVFVLGYLSLVWVAQALRKRVWQASLLAMFSVVFIGTVILQASSFLVLFALGTSLPPADVAGIVLLPSLLLNLLLSIPVYAWIRDLAGWVYPFEEFE